MIKNKWNSAQKVPFGRVKCVCLLMLNVNQIGFKLLTSEASIDCEYESRLVKIIKTDFHP